MMCLRKTSLQTFALLLLLLAPVAVRAQRERDRDAWNPSANSVEVSGRVSFSDRAGPAPNVTVRLERFGSGVLEQMATDPQGRFRFAGLARGVYVVVAAAPCYMSAQQQVELQIIFRSYIELDLRPDTSAGCAGAAAAAGGSVVDARVPAEARAEFERARAALRERKTARAVEHLERAVSIHPDFFAAQLLLATAHAEAARWERAESALRRALRIDPRSAPAHVALADLHRRRKNYPEAERSLAEALKLDADYWPGHFMLARVHWDAGDVVRAGNEVGRTLQLNPDYAEAHLLAGNVLLKVRQPARALSEFEEYLRLAPDGEVAPQARDIVKRLKSSLASSQ